MGNNSVKNIKGKLLALGLSSFLATSGVIVANHEGLVLGTYIDPVGILTSCFGHTGPELKLKQEWTEDQCLQQLAEDLSKHDKEMMKYILVPLSDEERASYLSFTYNVGVGAFSKSTLLKKLNSDNRAGACNELLRWNKAGGVVLKGLTTRRISESELCLKGVNRGISE